VAGPEEDDEPRLRSVTPRSRSSSRPARFEEDDEEDEVDPDGSAALSQKLAENYDRLTINDVCADKDIEQALEGDELPDLAVWVHKNGKWTEMDESVELAELWRVKVNKRPQSACRTLVKDLFGLSEAQYKAIRYEFNRDKSGDLVGIYKAKDGRDVADIALVIRLPDKGYNREALAAGAGVLGTALVGSLGTYLAKKKGWFGSNLTLKEKNRALYRQLRDIVETSDFGESDAFLDAVSLDGREADWWKVKLRLLKDVEKIAVLRRLYQTFRIRQNIEFLTEEQRKQFKELEDVNSIEDGNIESVLKKFAVKDFDDAITKKMMSMVDSKRTDYLRDLVVGKLYEELGVDKLPAKPSKKEPELPSPVASQYQSVNPFASPPKYEGLEQGNASASDYNQRTMQGLIAILENEISLLEQSNNENIHKEELSRKRHEHDVLAGALEKLSLNESNKTLVTPLFGQASDPRVESSAAPTEEARRRTRVTMKSRAHIEKLKGKTDLISVEATQGMKEALEELEKKHDPSRESQLYNRLQGLNIIAKALHAQEVPSEQSRPSRRRHQPPIPGDERVLARPDAKLQGLEHPSAARQKHIIRRMTETAKTPEDWRKVKDALSVIGLGIEQSNWDALTQSAPGSALQTVDRMLAQYQQPTRNVEILRAIQDIVNGYDRAFTSEHVDEIANLLNLVRDGLVSDRVLDTLKSKKGSDPLQVMSHLIRVELGKRSNQTFVDRGAQIAETGGGGLLGQVSARESPALREHRMKSQPPPMY
jgi:hypothetical protein